MRIPISGGLSLTIYRMQQVENREPPPGRSQSNEENEASNVPGLSKCRVRGSRISWSLRMRNLTNAENKVVPGW